MDNNELEDIVARIGQTPTEALARLFKASYHVGDKKYPGKVVNNNDPLKLGRCRIRVYNVLDAGIPDNDLPWAIPESSFVGSLVGNFIVPPIDAIVWVRFDDAEVTSPMYSTKVLDRNHISSNKDDDYPDSMVLFEADNGEFLRSNRKTLETLYQHSSGTIIKIDALGNVTIDATGIFKVNAPIVNFPPGVVAPSGTGPFCAMPMDPLTGMPQTGTIEVRQG